MGSRTGLAFALTERVIFCRWRQPESIFMIELPKIDVVAELLGLSFLPKR